ncbi:MAG: NAD(P)/FAD-dependent oxidoreductase [bacterium]|nr:NAD(P)/FAD-dependent oxidoreductase [bacterium]
MDYEYEVLIIGAGLSGLAAGIRLAHFGRRVCILEKQVRAGGLNSWYPFQGRILDVGLHAVTNYVPRSVKSAPLARILRQLRLSHDDLRLCPQRISRIIFPEKELSFTNDFQLLVQEIADKFPSQVDGFLKLTNSLADYAELSSPGREMVSARKVLKQFLSDPLLIEMLLCPIMFYGNCREDDMDFVQFSILFRSIFTEGFARPKLGMRQLIQLLVDKYQESGGELRYGCQVHKLIINQGRVAEVHLANGRIMQAKVIISTVGLPETRSLCSFWPAEAKEPKPGEIAFVESILMLDCLPSQSLGFETTILFYNDTERFVYRKPNGLIDSLSGVICCPNNYQEDEQMSTEGLVRLTHLANFDLWSRLDQDEYRRQKEHCLRESVEKAERFIRGLGRHIVACDTFTPRTIQRFTARQKGAVYGTPDKLPDGRTEIKNLYVCGTDQGLVGIVGALLSGITVANRWVLYGA